VRRADAAAAATGALSTATALCIKVQRSEVGFTIREGAARYGRHIFSRMRVNSILTHIRGKKPSSGRGRNNLGLHLNRFGKTMHWSVTSFHQFHS
jgi:hypothetical protein